MSKQPPPRSPTQTTKGKKVAKTPLHVPPGFVLATATDGARYAAPDFMISAAELAIEAEQMKQTLRTGQAAGGPFPHNYGPAVSMGDAPRIPCPPDPGLTERELLVLHAEVLALQNQLGISYKDAAHRLYLAEAKAAFVAAEAITSIRTMSSELDGGLQHIIRQGVAASDPNHMSVDK
ncbi:hypothetical protein CPB83DRAFT_897313 [Crepidotus variabilis]|uniref:Uncharacterized protein n=1 Tax=Crepidotus variabilis TaxID=179855 RepID=A0A9P6JLA8_9AGAR|nr:hypothetical protein CPB83DRAFT_897313 [Crepidotus variabilis]